MYHAISERTEKMKDFVFTDKNGKKVTINKGFRFSATDRNGTTHTYEFSGEMYYYELVLTDLTDGTETRVVSNWFSERVINFENHKKIKR